MIREREEAWIHYMKICNQADEFILDNINPNYAHDLLYLEGAGVTHPDPGYYIQRTQRDRCFRYLYVMEYVISGKGYIECDGKCLDVQAGDFYFLNQGIDGDLLPGSEHALRKTLGQPQRRVHPADGVGLPTNHAGVGLLYGLRPWNRADSPHFAPKRVGNHWPLAYQTSCVC